MCNMRQFPLNSKNSIFRFFIHLMVFCTWNNDKWSWFFVSIDLRTIDIQLFVYIYEYYGKWKQEKLLLQRLSYKDIPYLSSVKSALRACVMPRILRLGNRCRIQSFYRWLFFENGTKITPQGIWNSLLFTKYQSKNIIW